MRLIDADKLIDDYNKSDGTISDLMELILDAAEQKQPPNDPLTLDQLREMDGEPVWVERPGYTSRWALVFVFSKKANIIHLTFGNGIQPIAKTLIGRCKIYRRKPEEGEIWQQ